MIYKSIDYDSYLLEVFSYISLVISFGITVPLSLVECLRRSDSKLVTFNGMVKKDLDLFFHKINVNKYEKRGLDWHVIDGHYWIELRIYNSAIAQQETIKMTDS